MLFLGSFISTILNLEISNSLTVILKSDITANILQSITHSSIISLGTIYYFYTGKTDYYPWIKLYSIGYLIADGLYFYLYRKLSHQLVYLTHHILFVISWIVCDKYDFYLFNLLLLSEITTPFINLKFICKNLNYRKLEVGLSLTTYPLFLIFRVLNFSYVVYITYQRQVYIIWPLLLPLTGMQYYWFYLMSCKLYKFLS
jgi:hypothetical protein